MNTDIFTKTGELKKRSPKKYSCKVCDNKTSKPSIVKSGFASFYVCEKCGGSLEENSSYVEWEKRKTGQWKIEKDILEFISIKGEVSKDEIEDYFGELGKSTFEKATSIFSKSFSELVYWGHLKVRENNEIYYYKLNKETVK